MGSWLLRNILQRLLLLVLISFVALAVVYLAPGEPSAVDPSNPRLKAEDVEKIRAAFHLDEPIYRQYGFWLRDLFTGELRSFKDNQPVLPKIWQRFLNSLPLFLVATVIVWTISFPTGIHNALRRGGVSDRTSTALAYILISVPGFFLAYLMLLWLSKEIGVPVVGRETFGLENASTWTRWMDRIWHVTVPAILSALVGVALLSRYVRAEMVETVRSDFVRTARAKGLPESMVIYRHALRNALLPFVTMFGLMIPGLIGGSVIIEQIFAWPGIGRLGYDAILSRDFPVIITLNFFAACLTLIGTFISDLAYAWVDPRVRLE